MKIKKVAVELLKPYKNNARVHNDRQINLIARSIKQFGFTNPILIDKNNRVIAGHGRLLAAKKLGLSEIPTISIDHLSETEKQAYIIADNKLAEKAGWDNDILAIELQNIIDFDKDFDLTLTGLETPEIDLILHEATTQEQDTVDEIPHKAPKLVEYGDIWQLGDHRLICGDSLKKSTYDELLGNLKADIVVADAPYNLKVNGVVSGKGKIKRKEFAMASGEMSSSQFTEFLHKTFTHLKEFSRNGSIHYLFMDWRHCEEMINAAKGIYSTLLNICVWNKLSGGMGSFYRSQHEFVFVYKNGEFPHINNIELGVHGRYRTNVFNYPGIFINNKLNKENIKLHPTVKPVGLIVDIIKDASKRNGIVLDCFAGSGSTLLAAERTGRKAYLIEIDVEYCDIIIHRYQKITGKQAKLLKRIEEI
ncbi:MAG: site-specific DNA-methyltransferase [Endomicrobia bacterium]|nr:site-specific DNA-methyltransferase [Endomicrobiia bacterium]